MGRKASYLVMSLGAISSVTFIVSCFLPWHAIGWYSLTVQVARFNIYPAFVTYDATTADWARWCKPQFSSSEREHMQRNGQEPSRVLTQLGWFCKERTSIFSVQELAQRLCSETLMVFFPSACIGMEWAFVVGLTTVIIILLNAIVLQGIAAFLLYDYAKRKPSKRMRIVAGNLVAGGLVAVAAMLLTYALGVTTQLDALDGRFGNNFRFFLGKSSATGYSYGAFVAWFAWFIQVAQVILFQYVKSRDEQLVEEAKMDRQFVQEYGALADEIMEEECRDAAAREAAAGGQFPSAGAPLASPAWSSLAPAFGAAQPAPVGMAMPIQHNVQQPSVSPFVAQSGFGGPAAPASFGAPAFSGGAGAGGGGAGFGIGGAPAPAGAQDW